MVDLRDIINNMQENHLVSFV